jgi:sarcosine oxidase
MDTETYDLIVVGLGAVGSAALCQASLRGARVLGIDRFDPPHAFGSTHGETRITRQAVGEGAEFVPLVMRANTLWRAIEEATGETLLVQNGGLIVLNGEVAEGSGAAFYRQTVDCANRFNIAHELLDAGAMRRRYPQFLIQDGAQGYLEAGAGYLLPENCIRAQLKLAQMHGAEVRTGEIVTDIVPSGPGVVVRTNKSQYSAAGVVLAAGPWMADWAKAICGVDADHFAVYRQTLYWFSLQQPDRRFSPEQMPIFLWNSAKVEKGFYGFPSLDGVSLKMATEQFVEPSAAKDGPLEVPAEQAQVFYDEHVRTSLNGLTDRCMRAATCFYTVVPDHGFFIDHGVDSDRVWFASACSGHGFKHSAAVGEALAQRLLGESPAVDLNSFGHRRS